MSDMVESPLVHLLGEPELPYDHVTLLLVQDPDGGPHEPGGHLQHFVGHGGRQQDDLGLLVEMPEHLVDLV